jgi:hypothetical protein
MKRILVIALSTFMVMGMVSCSKEESPPKVEGKNTISQEENSIETIYFGKVKKLVGNEVDINIAKDLLSGALDGEGNGGNMEMTQSNASSTEGPVEDLGTQTSVAAAESAESEKVEGDIPGGGTEMKQEIIDSSKEDLKLEYTGESKSVVIPAGAIVFDLRSGKEVKLSDIKDGSVIRTYTKTSGNSEVVFRIEIVQ